VGPKPTQGMDVKCLCVCAFFCVCVQVERPCDELITRPRSPTDCLRSRLVHIIMATSGGDQMNTNEAQMCCYTARGYKRSMQNYDCTISRRWKDNVKITLCRPGSEDVTWIELARGRYGNGRYGFPSCRKFLAQLKVITNESVTTVTIAHFTDILVTKLMNVNDVSWSDGLVIFVP
jgi:hypothetical protein